MDTNGENQIAEEFSPFVRMYKDGRVERLQGTDILPPSTDPKTGVQSKDVRISPQGNVSARLYLPRNTNPDKKLPLLIYFHGGAFIIETPYSPQYHPHLNSLVSEANVIAVSVDYRRAPEHPLPIAYEDSWNAVEWVTSHKDGKGPEEWLNLHADFERIYFAGDSAGANISHHMAKKVKEALVGNEIKLEGIVLVHPYFWGKEPIEKESTDPEKRAFPSDMWHFASPATSGCDDPLINPDFDPKLSGIGCKRVLVFVAEEDVFRARGLRYKESLLKRGWKGNVEVFETEGEDHCFHLTKPDSERAVAMLKRVVQFLHQDNQAIF